MQNDFHRSANAVGSSGLSLASLKWPFACVQSRSIPAKALFTPKLQSEVSKTQFKEVFTYFGMDAIKTMRLEDIVEDENTSFAHFTISGDGFDEKLPAFAMHSSRSIWYSSASSPLSADSFEEGLCDSDSAKS